MKAVIVTIGDEILYGQTVDTNSAFIARTLDETGIEIQEIISVKDDASDIHKSLERSFEKAPIVVTTGGLGPTKDDLTKDVVADFFNCKMKVSEVVLQDLKKLLAGRDPKLLETNLSQADIPECAEPIRNKYGTAPGFWIHHSNKTLIVLPGVPLEMKAMIPEVVERIKNSFDLPKVRHQFIKTCGIAESILSDKLSDFEGALPEHIKLAYLPDLAQVKLRLTAKGSEIALEDQLNELKEDLNALLPEYIYGFEEDASLDMVVGEELKLYGKKLATAESCTGGYIAHMITARPGSSGYFDGSVTAYENGVKQKILGVKKETLDHWGAVSEQTVREMVAGVIKALGVDYGIATSGIAGPDGGTEEKPVGTVWIAVGGKENIIAKKFLFKGTREQNIKLSATHALNMLRQFLKNDLA